MSTCPFCGHRNLEGDDLCGMCQEPLDFLSRPHPDSDFEKSMITDRVQSLAPRRAVTVSPDTTVDEVLDLLVGQSIGCVVVCEHDEPLGIFSERDALVRLKTDIYQHAERPIRDFMTPNPETIDRDARIAQALAKMDIGGYRHLPVTTRGRVSGVISIRDILDYMTARLLATAD